MQAVNNVDVTVVVGDISEAAFASATTSRCVSWDIETTGLDWRTDSIATCQIYVEGFGVEVVRINEAKSERLVELLESPHVRKIFHHAMFDLRFMCAQWKVEASEIECTKIAAKLAEPGRASSEYSLKPLLGEYLRVEIDKRQQVSDWGSTRLTSAQIAYAASDVIYLPRLLAACEQRLMSRGLLGVARRCFDHIPTRVELELLGVGDVFEY